MNTEKRIDQLEDDAVTTDLIGNLASDKNARDDNRNRSADSRAEAETLRQSDAPPANRNDAVSKASEFVELFVFASVHADLKYQTRQGRVAIDELVRRCLDMAKGEGVTPEQIRAEVGDLAEYFRAVIDGKNVDEAARLAADSIADREAGKS